MVLVLTSREQRQYASASAVVEEALSAIRTVVAYGGEKVEAERYICVQGDLTWGCYSAYMGRRLRLKGMYVGRRDSRMVFIIGWSHVTEGVVEIVVTPAWRGEVYHIVSLQDCVCMYEKVALGWGNTGFTTEVARFIAQISLLVQLATSLLAPLETFCWANPIQVGTARAVGVVRWGWYQLRIQSCEAYTHSENWSLGQWPIVQKTCKQHTDYFF